MAANKQQVKVWTSTTLKERVSELAWRQRKSISDVVRDEIRALIRMDNTNIDKLKQPLGRNYDEPIVAIVDRKLWAQGMEKAHASGITIPEFFRAHIESQLSKYDL